MKSTNFQVRVSLSFFSCAKNQEDARRNQEMNRQEIFSKDYCQQHKGTWS
jgi:hypothetical protein